jgi:3-phenylpropionate/trans-cinnamate dioxygenase ferredoxin reductase subunit
MADRSVDMVLIGGGIAAASAAAELRERGFDGSILLATRELEAPYHRPPVTKGLLTGKDERHAIRIHPEDWWERQNVELRTRSGVMALDTDAREATLANKETVAFGQALLATGAMVRRLDVDGTDLEGVHYLRAPGNAESLRSDVESVERILIVGGSYIGCEVAASLTSAGQRCTILMQESEPLERGFGPQVGAAVRRLLEQRGVEIHGAQEVARIEGDERAAAVISASGERFEAEAVVIGVGAIPDVMLAKKAGLELGDAGGVRCDSRLRTSAEGVYAAGDMCEFESVLHGRHVRIEHEEVAAAQGCTAARNMLGEDVAHEIVPYFWSDLADWASLEYVGLGGEWDEEEWDGSPEDDDFTVVYRRAGRVVGALALNRGDALDEARRRIVADARATGKTS